jgi:hypothetical protein
MVILGAPSDFKLFRTIHYIIALNTKFQRGIILIISNHLEQPGKILASKLNIKKAINRP